MALVFRLVIVPFWNCSRVMISFSILYDLHTHTHARVHFDAYPHLAWLGNLFHWSKHLFPPLQKRVRATHHATLPLLRCFSTFQAPMEYPA